MKVSVIYQGSTSSLSGDEKKDLVNSILALRDSNENIEIIVSTWKGENVSFLKKIVDKIIFSNDPGALPGLKTDGKLNNVNRLIESSRSGLKAASGDICVKLRIDLLFYMPNIADFYKSVNEKYDSIVAKDFSRKIICCNLFTIDPRFIERMSYHVSDWFQLGAKVDLIKFWDIELYKISDALFYSFHQHRQGTNAFERKFQSRIAVEQYIQKSGMDNFGVELPINFHNQIVDKKEFYEFLLSHYIIKDLPSLYLMNKKYDRLSKELWVKFLCIGQDKYDDIYRLYVHRESRYLSDVFYAMMYHTIMIISFIKTSMKKIIHLVRMLGQF